MLYRLYRKKINIARNDKIKTVVENICLLLLVDYVKRLLKKIVKKRRNLRNILNLGKEVYLVFWQVFTQKIFARRSSFDHL